MVERSEPVDVLIPAVDDSRCTGCGVCAEVCAFGAITVIGTTVLVFPELCHSCGACTLLCPEGAIREAGRHDGTSGTCHRWRSRDVARGSRL